MMSCDVCNMLCNVPKDAWQRACSATLLWAAFWLRRTTGTGGRLSVNRRPLKMVSGSKRNGQANGGNNGGTGEGEAPPPAPKVVGPNITGTVEEYRLERRLQKGLFGGVYEARGLTSGRGLAVKVLHRSELHRAQRASSLEFCEVPLSEVKYKDVMANHENVMAVEDHFQDQYCHYIVFELARGGDLLEALKLRPNGFEERHAQFLIGQAARGLALLHRRQLAMQDVSLENMLLHVLEDGRYQVKVCDPGQAVVFGVDANTGAELPVNFHGFVGKSFRPPELHRKVPYLATKVDAWCLGWSTFYLLAAQPLFMSADASDPDWALFEAGNVATLFRQKVTFACSQTCVDFMLRLLQINADRRMSVEDALKHDFLADSSIRPMYAPAEIVEQVREANAAAPPAVPAEPPQPSERGRPCPENCQLARSETGDPAVARGYGSASGGAPPAPDNASGSSAPASCAPAGVAQAAARCRSSQRGCAAAIWKAPASPMRSESPRTAAVPGQSVAARPPSQGPQGPQVRTASPFQSTYRGFLVTPQSRALSPQPAPQQQVSGTALYGRASAASASSYSTAGLSGLRIGSGYCSGLGSGIASAGGILNGSGDDSDSAPGPGGVPVTGPSASAPVGERHEGMVTAEDERYGIGGGPMGQAVRAREPPSPKLNRTDVNWRRGVGQPSAPCAPRASSPIGPATPLFVRTGNARGFSPSPMRSLGGLEPAYARPSSTGSPMSANAYGQPLRASPATSDAAGGHFWQSPRAASPASLTPSGASLRTTPEPARNAYSRGRSRTRALSPPQLPHYGAQAASAVSTGGLVARAVSPGQLLAPAASMPGLAAGRAAGIAWSPVPPSPPAPKRSISPTPAGSSRSPSLAQGHIRSAVPNYQATSSVPRWPG